MNTETVFRLTDEIILSIFQMNNVNLKAHFLRVDAA